MRRLGIAAPFAAFYGVLAALVVACLVFRMPVASAFSAFARFPAFEEASTLPRSCTFADDDRPRK